MIMTLLMKQLYFYINNNKEYLTYDYLIENIINNRNKYLKKNNLNILDDTPFKEFIIDCIGETISSDRKFRLLIAENIKLKKRIKFIYDPTLKNINFDPKKFNFDNSSGNINNTKNKILNL